MHNIIGDIIEWDVAQKAYLVGEGQSGERYIQRLEAAGLCEPEAATASTSGMPGTRT
jgi:hypothetical protein